ncbi:MAG: hypothetical protein KJ064_12805 [Anaerolineae bacterium]|nr:hypothetical protein [Anaerolineae bacterium]
MFQLFDAISFALERLWQHRILVLCALAGLTVATTLAISLTLYVDAVNTKVLASRLDTPPYAFRFRYVGSWKGNITQEDVTSTNGAIQTQFDLELPIEQLVQFTRAGSWSLRSENISLGAFSLGTLKGAENQMNIVAGEWPAESEAGRIPVLLPQQLLYTMGLQVGDELSAQRPDGTSLTLVIAAMWESSTNGAWIFPPKYFETVLLVDENAFWKAVEGIERPVEEVAWYLVFDGSHVKTSDVSDLVSRIVDGQRSISRILPGVQMDISPRSGLEQFLEDVQQLTQQLVIMVLPVSGLVLYFVSLVGGMLVRRQQQEDVTLSSRGMSRFGIVGNHLLMWLMLVAASLMVGIVAAPYVVQLVGQTTSFLRFGDTRSGLTPVLTSQALTVGGGVSLLAASSALLLAWRVSGHNITSYKRAATRTSKAWWQKLYLDVMALVPALYVLYTLWQRGGLITEAENPFSDPLSFMGPTLFALGATLFFLRFWPFLLSILANLLSYSTNISLLMALRELTRSAGQYRGGIMMMCFTLSLTGFMASMASTIDRSLVDSINYKVGADVVLETAADAETETQAAEEEGASPTEEVTGYNTLPATDLLPLEGVYQVSRVGRYPAQLILPTQRVSGTVLGIDRESIASVVHQRSDYASEPFADLFNRLAGQRNGIILNAMTAKEYNLIVGQEITFQFQALDAWYEIKAPIIALVDYFPTLDPRDGFFILTSLDPLFEAAGTQLPHQLWMQREPGTSLGQIQEEVASINFPVLRWRESDSLLQEAQSAPERRGVLGFLSVGFVAAIILTLVIAIIQSVASFRTQVMQLGTLQAMGMGHFSVSLYLVILQGLASGSGILGGTVIGFATTLLYLPLLDFSGGLPPYLVRVAWDDIITVYAIFAGILFAVTFLTTILLSRQQLMTIVKLGEG